MLRINDVTQIWLGIQGENQARNIEIDVSDWVEDFPDAGFSVWMTAPGGTVPQATGASYVTADQKIVWSPSSTDTYVAGEGEAEIRLSEGNVVKKTKKIRVGISGSVTGGGSTLGPDWQEYIDEADRIRALAVAAQLAAEQAQSMAETAAEETEGAADMASQSATAAAGSATEAASSASAATTKANEASQSATAAAGSASAAASSATAASNSKDTAVSAKTAAETAASNATGAATAAETAQGEAENAQAAAEQAQAAAEQAAQDAQETVQDVVDDISDLKSALKLNVGSYLLTTIATGKYVDLSGGVGSNISMSSGYPSISNGGAYTLTIDNCSVGDIFTINGTGGGSTRLWAFVSSTGEILSVANAYEYAREKILIAPANSAFIITHSNDGTKSYSGLQNRLMLDNLLDSVSCGIIYANMGTARYIDVSGGVGATISMYSGYPTVTSGGSSALSVVPCSEGDIFTVNGKGGASSSKLWAFINSNGKILSMAEPNEESTNKILTAPADSAFLIVQTTDGRKTYVGRRVSDSINAICDFHDEITEHGKNYFDKNVTDNVVLNASLDKTNGNILGNISGRTVSYFIPIKANTVYTISSRIVIIFYTSDKTYISGFGLSDIIGNTFLTPTNASYIRVAYNTSDKNTLQLEEGMHATDYEPYKHIIKSDYLDLSENSFDEHKNSLINYGDNLLNNITLFENQSIYSSGDSIGVPVALNGYILTDYIPVEANTVYTTKRRHTLVWFDEYFEPISGVGSGDQSMSVTSPATAKYVRFSYIDNGDYNQINKGESLADYDLPHFKSEYMPLNTYGCQIENIKLGQESPNKTISNLCVVAGKTISSVGKVPDYDGYLLYDKGSEKFYYSSPTPDKPIYLADWASSLAGESFDNGWMATITADGDIICLKAHQRTNPIIYSHDNYANPFVVDFGANLKPYGWLMSGSIVQLEDGSFVFGEYKSHSLEDEQNNDPRIIWRVSKPYNNINNWTKAHQFKHVYYASPISDEPDNEIGHIHAIMFDHYSGDMYCTTGDIDRHCRMWISSDFGATWSAVDGAVGPSDPPNAIGVGQKWRMTSSIFTDDAMYWATDSFFSYHNLWKCNRDASGHVDFSTLTKLINLEMSIQPGNTQATYNIVLIREPYGLLMLDRTEPRNDNKLDIRFYDLKQKALYVCKTLGRASDADTLEQSGRTGLPNQFWTMYQPQSLDYVVCGGDTAIRPNVTDIFNNSADNYVGGLKVKVIGYGVERNSN